MLHDLSAGANIAIFGAAAAVVWFAGTYLAGYADALAEKTGIGHAVVGLLLLGGITSLPEIAVGTAATLQGTPLLSVNDVLGSAAINLVILALADAVLGKGALTAVQGSPVLLLQGVLGILMMAMAVGASVAGSPLIFGIGVWCWLMLGVYGAGIWLLAKSNAERAWQPINVIGRDIAPRDADAHEGGLSPLIWKIAAAGLFILTAGYLLATTGEAIAEQTGLGTSFFGAVFLGFSTSLPEISTVVAAVRLKRYEMAIADIFGTNLFNVNIIVLVDALHPGGSVLVEAGRFAAFAALLALILTTIFLVGLIERRDRTVLRMGFDSLAAILVYVAGVGVLYALK